MAKEITLYIILFPFCVLLWSCFLDLDWHLVDFDCRSGYFINTDFLEEVVQIVVLHYLFYFGNFSDSLYEK